jgi:hypothetical protein
MNMIVSRDFCHHAASVGDGKNANSDNPSDGRLAESDLREFAKFIGMKEMKKSCPYERESNRAKVREILERMKQLSPDLEYSMWSAMENIKLDYLPHILGKSSL